MKLKLYGDNGQLWQWDTDQKMVVEDDGTCNEVHFCNRSSETALVVPIREQNGIRLVDVPNILLQESSALTAYLYHYDADGSETRFSYHFPLRPRPKPEGYVYTETEVLNYASLDKRLNALEGEGLAQAVADYLKENPVQAGATAEEAAQIRKNKEDIEKLSTDKLDATKLPEAVNDALTQAKASGEFKGEPGNDGKTPVKGVDYFTEADVQEIAEQAAELVEVPEGSNVNPVAKTAEMTQPVGVDSDGKLFTKPSAGGGSGENTETTMTDFVGYTGMQFFDNGNVRAYNPIVNTTAWNERCRKVSALMQKAAESAPLASTEGVMAHESSMTFSGGTFGILSWVENVAGTAADVPGEAGITAVKGRLFLLGGSANFPSSVPKLHGDNTFIIAQKGDSANNTITGEDFTIPGGVGYQTSIDGKVLCGYVHGYNKLAGLTCVTSVNAFEELSVTSRHTWTLTIDGVLGEYNYSRLPAGLTGATLHPSNQIAKINNTYYRADVVPNNGFVVFSSTDLINWTYIGHATFPEGFDDKSATEACCGAKAGRLYVAVRQAPESACLYVAKMNTDMCTVNSCVALPDCGSKPCFTKELNGGSNSGKSLFLAIAPADRYGCKVYYIPTNYSMTHIYPVFELHGVSCNYPFIFQVGVDPDWVIIAGTNGAQANKKGVSLVPAAIYDRIAGQIDIPAVTDNIVHNADGAVAFGGLYDALT